MLMAAVAAGEQTSAEQCGATGGNIGQGAAMAGQYPSAEARKIRLAVAADNLGQLDHPLEIVVELIESGVEAGEHPGGEVGIDGRGLQALVAEQLLDDP